MKKIATVFAHYDKNDIIDDYVIYYLSKLSEISSEIYFVSTATLPLRELSKIKKICKKIILRDNVGYDFMSYKIGINEIDLERFDNLILCNDSVYGPLYDLEKIFLEMEDSLCDFWGMTENYNVSYHLQSYFLVFKKRMFLSGSFRNFWDSVDILNSKKEIILKYEIGLTRYFMNNNFTPLCYSVVEYNRYFYLARAVKYIFSVKFLMFIFRNIFRRSAKDGSVEKILVKRNGWGFNFLINYHKALNHCHFYWDKLVNIYGMPFIKVELLRDNPCSVDISRWRKVLGNRYDYSLIEHHLDRVGSNFI